MVKCLKIIKRGIKKSDIFGVLITFRINNEEEYKTIHGGIATIIFLLFTLFYTIYLGVPFVKRENIDFIYSNKILDSNPYINLSEAHFRFGFGLQYQNDSSPAIKDSEIYFNYSITLKERFNKKKIIEYPFGLQKCSREDFLNKVNETFDRNHIYEMFCPILNDSINYTLQGLFTDDYSKYIQLEIRLTEYGMYHFEEVRAFMQATPIEITMYFLDTGIDYRNRSTPLPFYINYINKGLDLIFTKTTEVFLSVIEFTNDENIIINHQSKSIDGMFDKSEDSFHYVLSRIDSNESLVGRFIIKASSRVIILDRKYQKFPSYAAQLFGLLEELFLILSVIVNFLEREAIRNRLIRKMLKMKGSKNYDVKYFLHVFKKNKYYGNDIMELVNKKNFMVVKSGREEIIFKDEEGKYYSKKLTINKKTDNSSIEEKEDNYSQIKNNINIQSTEREVLNLNDKKKQIIIKKDSLNDNEYKISESISSIPSEDMNDYNKTNVKRKITNDKYNIQKEAHFTYTNMNLNTENNIENNFPNVEILSKMRRKKTIERAEEDFPFFTIYSNFYSSIVCFCSKYQRRKFQLIKNAKRKINYYLEICNYIKAMHEVDLFKYCLLDNKQSVIFDYLSRPPFKVDSKINKDLIYKEFEKEQDAFGKMKRNDIDKIFASYNFIKNKEDFTFEDLKLLRLFNAEAEYLK